VIIGEERHEKKMQQNKTSRDASMLGGQDKKKANNKLTGLTGSNGGLTGLTGVKTGLTGVSSKSGNSSEVKNKTRPIFKEALAKYERREPPRNRGDGQTKPRMRSHNQDLVSNRILVHVKVIVLLCHTQGRLLHGFGCILVIIRLWIIVGCIYYAVLFYSISFYISKLWYLTKTDYC